MRIDLFARLFAKEKKQHTHTHGQTHKYTVD